MEKAINNLKDILFGNKKRIIITVIALLLASFLIWYLVFAEDDEFKDHIIVNANVSQITDGTVNADNNMDTCTSDGCDNALDNKIVRNYDSVGYTVSYNLKIDEKTTNDLVNQGYENSTTLRTVNAIVIIPKNTNAKIEQSSVGGQNFSMDTEGDYYYAIYSFNEIVAFSYDSTIEQNNTFTFWINNINMSNGSKIKPIILMYDSATSINIKEVIQSVTSGNQINDDNANTYQNIKNIQNIDEVTVTGAANYSVYLYPGTSVKDTDGNRIFSTAIVLGLNNDSNRGFKGQIIPSSADVNLSLTSDNQYSSYELVNTADERYDYTAGSNLTIYNNLPYITDLTENEQNAGSFTLTDSTDESVWMQASFGKDSDEPIKNLEKDASYFDDMKIVTEKVFRFKANRDSSNTVDSVITLTASNGSNIATLNFDDIAGDYIGSLSSSLNFYDEESDKMASTKRKNGMASYNFGETFYIDTTLKYADVYGGEDITDFINYIKIDNDAIDIVPQVSDDATYYNLKLNGAAYSDEENTNPVTFIYGTWNVDTFEVVDNAPSTCPTLSNLTKDELMNLYGGPCIKLKEGKYVESNELDETKGSVMIVKTSIPKVTADDKININLRANIKNNSSLANNNTYKVVTNSVAKFNNETYYLSKDKGTSDTIVMSDKNNYTKTVYDYTNKVVTTNESIKSTSIAGNTIIISAVKAYKPTVNTYYDNSIKTVFDDYPIVFDINAKSSIPKTMNYDHAEVNVYLPMYLTFIDANMNNSPIVPVITSETIDGTSYNVYTFTFDSDKIEDNSVNFKIDVDRAFNTPTEIDQTVLIKSNYYVKNKDDESVIYSDINSDSERTTTHTITIRNESDILTSGAVSPRLIEVNTPYDYLVKAFNNSAENNMELLYILPYTNDISSSDVGSVVSGEFEIKLDNLPDGYKAYYTNVEPKIILGNELESPTITNNNEWKEWTNYNQNTSNVTAVKIVSNSKISRSSYFAAENGLKFTIIPKNNKIGDEYYNNFTMISIKDNNASYFVSSTSIVASVYNRKVSGFAFEDADYDGLYSSDTENTLSDIPVEIYKIANEETKKDSNVLDIMTTNDKKVLDTVTGADGTYSFRGLDAGYYYVKYTFDCDKYTTTDKLAASENVSNSTFINSNANMLTNECSAVSDVIELTDQNLEVSNINLGLAIRKQFGVNLKKYITKVVVNSNKGTDTYTYDNKNKVRIDLKNLKNTKFEVTYKFEIENSKYFPGYVGFIGEAIPNGMTFDSSKSENDGWIENNGILYYTKLSNSLLMPGEKYYFTIVLNLENESGGSYVNIVTASNFSVLGEEPYKLNFDDIILNTEENNDNSTSDDNTNNENNQTQNQDNEENEE